MTVRTGDDRLTRSASGRVSVDPRFAVLAGLLGILAVKDVPSVKAQSGRSQLTLKDQDVSERRIRGTEIQNTVPGVDEPSITALAPVFLVSDFFKQPSTNMYLSRF